VPLASPALRRPPPRPRQVTDLERKAAASAAAGRSVSDVDAELGEVEARRSHKEVDREQLMRKQVRVRGVGWGRGQRAQAMGLE
jgi:hypothetical protein